MRQYLFLFALFPPLLAYPQITGAGHTYPGISIKVPKNLDDIKEFNPLPVEYPPAENDEKFILVDLSEQFLGAYEYGKLAFSAPAATGEKENESLRGEFKVAASHRYHKSSKYFIEKAEILYPMNHALRFHINREGVTYRIHGRDIPGYPASYGCMGLYDEAMQIVLRFSEGADTCGCKKII